MCVLSLYPLHVYVSGAEARGGGGGGGEIFYNWKLKKSMGYLHPLHKPYLNKSKGMDIFQNHCKNAFIVYKFTFQLRGSCNNLLKICIDTIEGPMDNRKAMTYCACSRCGWVLLDIFCQLCLFSFSLPLGLKYCLKGSLNT